MVSFTIESVKRTSTPNDTPIFKLHFAICHKLFKTREYILFFDTVGRVAMYPSCHLAQQPARNYRKYMSLVLVFRLC